MASLININLLCARTNCQHPLWWHLWKNAHSIDDRWEIGVCHGTDSQCVCVGFSVFANPSQLEAKRGSVKGHIKEEKVNV